MLTRVDIRFSKDPTPYKTYFSAAWSRTGRKGPYAHYYVQIQPNGGTFVGKLVFLFGAQDLVSRIWPSRFSTSVEAR
jgi:uncharacterized protein (DUF2461 family)